MRVCFSSKLLALIGGTTIASSYPSIGACNICAIVRSSAIAIRVRCWSTNRIRGFGQLGKGKLHMGRSGCSHGYCSGGDEVHRKGWVRVVCLDGKSGRIGEQGHMGCVGKVREYLCTAQVQGISWGRKGYSKWRDISPESSSGLRLISKGVFSQKETPSLGNALSLSNRFEDTFGVEADLSNMETSIPVSPTPTFRIHKDHPKSQIIGPVNSLVQTRHKSKEMEEQSFIATIHQKINPELLQFCLFLCFLSQEEPKKIFDALKDLSWVEAMQEELLQFKIQNVWILVDYPKGMDVKSAFLYGTIDEEVYVMQPPRFQEPKFPDRVYKVEKAMYGLHQAPRAWYVYVDDIIFGSSNPLLCREFEALMHDKFQMSAMGELTFFLGLQVLQKKDGIFLSQDKYVGDILKKFRYSNVRSANTPMDKENPWGKYGPGKDVELHLYRSIIGLLMYLIASRPDIMFAVCTYARHQVTPKECHLYAVKRIFRYLKGHPNMGLWYPQESPFDLVAYSDSDYGCATKDRKLTTRGCQFLGRRLISWQCKKQTIMATSITEAEYVAAASGRGQVLCIQN
nr:hypothetical protein [Tanacetum cinerariifolium]